MVTGGVVLRSAGKQGTGYGPGEGADGVAGVNGLEETVEAW